MKSIVEQIAERKNVLAELEAPDALAAMHKWYKPQLLSTRKHLQAAISANTSRRIKIYRIQTIMSELRENPAAHTACKKGCSNCCHMHVMLSQSEADAIGSRIARRPIQLNPEHKMQGVNAYGRETPCTFLVDGACSIYENRPFICRDYVNSDRDNLLCSFENWDLLKTNDPRCVFVPRPDAQFLVKTYINICRADVFGDIRDFFPA